MVYPVDVEVLVIRGPVHMYLGCLGPVVGSGLVATLITDPVCEVVPVTAYYDSFSGVNFL